MTTRSPLLDDPLGDHDEVAWVGRAQAGDREALESLVRCHSPWICNIALRMLCHPDDAEDASQEILAYFDPVSGKRFDGFDAVKGLIEPVRGRLHYDSIEFIAPSVRRYGDTAVLTYSLLTHGARFDGHAATEGAWNTTNVYSYANGEGRIVHSHFARRTALP